MKEDMSRLKKLALAIVKIYSESNKITKRDADILHKAITMDRPQGEWIKVKEERMSIDMSGEIVTRYKCSKCGRLILTIPSNLADYPFCHCGADMRGAEE